MVKIDMSVVGPQLSAQLLASHHLPRILKQQDEDAKGLAAKPKSDAVLSELAKIRNDFETLEAECAISTPAGCRGAVRCGLLHLSLSPLGPIIAKAGAASRLLLADAGI
jgi:hypothetical protein